MFTAVGRRQFNQSGLPPQRDMGDIDRGKASRFLSFITGSVTGWTSRSYFNRDGTWGSLTSGSFKRL